MGRPGYLSLYADERTQQIFDEFVKIKGVSKSTALTEMLEIYMLCTDEELYQELLKKSLGVETAKRELLQRRDIRQVNDYIFMKLGSSTDQNGDSLDGHETMEAYMRNIEENGLGYSWFSTQSLHFGMAKEMGNPLKCCLQLEMKSMISVIVRMYWKLYLEETSRPALELPEVNRMSLREKNIKSGSRFLIWKRKQL